MSTSERPMWFRHVGGSPIKADEWRSKIPPDWWCHEGDDRWTPWDPSQRFETVTDCKQRRTKKASKA